MNDEQPKEDEMTIARGSNVLVEHGVPETVIAYTDAGHAGYARLIRYARRMGLSSANHTVDFYPPRVRGRPADHVISSEIVKL